MSLSTLARDEILRSGANLRSIQSPKISQTQTEIWKILNIDRAQTASLEKALTDLATSQPVQETKTSSALEALVKYIPTESVTLYVAAISSLTALQATIASRLTSENLYWLFAVLTPILFLFIFAGKRRSNDLPPFPPLGQWPWWKMAASTIAFLAWALAVPEGPYLKGEYGGTVAALLALVASTFLSILAAAIEKPVT